MSDSSNSKIKQLLILSPGISNSRAQSRSPRIKRNNVSWDTGSVSYSDQIDIGQRRCHANIRSITRKESLSRLRIGKGRSYSQEQKQQSNMVKSPSCISDLSGFSSEDESVIEEHTHIEISPPMSLAPEKYPITKRAHFIPDWYKVVVAHQGNDNIPEPDMETREVCNDILRVKDLRDEWVYKPAAFNHNIGCQHSYKEFFKNVSSDDKNESKNAEIQANVKLEKVNSDSSDFTMVFDDYSLKFDRGVMHVFDTVLKSELFIKKTFEQYLNALNEILGIVGNGPVKTFCYRRLQILKARFDLHLWLNDAAEMAEIKSVPHRDFYNVRKIDNHVHHSACMSQKHMLRFIKRKLKKEPNTIVYKAKGKQEQSLKDVFDDIGISAYELSIDALDMHAHQQTFQRFDKFNAKYNPVNRPQLRTVFLKIDNYIQGRFLAEITKEIFNDLEDNKYQFAEYRLSIYGKKAGEWDILSDWICKYKLYSFNVRWLIQMPRIYQIFRKNGLLKNFHEMMYNFFVPLFEVTLNPKSHPALHVFLQYVVGFDSVDDESAVENKRRHYADPLQWTHSENPPYIYYAYYMWVNICKLNRLREKRNLNTFAFRPHCGEAGSSDHLACMFLLANGINHGIILKKVPVLQYLYYLTQIPISMSPLSNNILFTAYDANPFPAFFRRGLNIGLSTDDPLLIHYTKDALLEEYSIAAQVYNLSAVDLCELARNSVRMSGWDYPFKQHCIGKDYALRGRSGNDIFRTNVPDCRVEFRDSLLLEEENFLIYAGYQMPFTVDVPVISNNISTTDRKSVMLTSRLLKRLNSNIPFNIPEEPITPFNLNSMQKVTSVSIPDNQYITLLANEHNSQITDEVPHAAWVKLLNEKRKLKTIRNELELITERTNAMLNDEVIRSSASFEILDKPLKISKKQKKELLDRKHKRTIDDIVGVYYDEQHMINEIKDDYTIYIHNSKVKLSMKLKNNNNNRNLIILECMVDEKKICLDDPKITALINFQISETPNKFTLVSCKLDIVAGELIWDSGAVWFKKEWKILSGAWEDSSSHMIEILPRNECRFIGGYGPFMGEFTGFKRLRIKLPNEHFLEGNLVSSNIIEWEHENGKWVKLESKGCLIM